MRDRNVWLATFVIAVATAVLLGGVAAWYGAAEERRAGGVATAWATEERDDAGGAAGPPETQMMPKVGILGRQAPRWQVDQWFNPPEGRDGIDVSDFRGKVLYLYGFQSWCPGCHRYGFPTMQRLIDHYRGNDDVAFVAIQTTFEGFTTNDADGAKRTVERYGLTIPVGHSGSRGRRSPIMQQYRTGGTPWIVLIDRTGRVRFNDFHIELTRAIEMIDTMLE